MRTRQAAYYHFVVCGLMLNRFGLAVLLDGYDSDGEALTVKRTLDGMPCLHIRKTELSKAINACTDAGFRDMMIDSGDFGPVRELLAEGTREKLSVFAAQLKLLE